MCTASGALRARAHTHNQLYKDPEFKVLEQLAMVWFITNDENKKLFENEFMRKFKRLKEKHERRYTKEFRRIETVTDRIVGQFHSALFTRRHNLRYPF